MMTDLDRARTLRDQGISAYRSGDHQRARTLLEESASLNIQDEHTFLWLSAVLESVEERRECLEHVLTINPNNQAARNGLAKLGPRPEPAVVPHAAPATAPAPQPAVSLSPPQAKAAPSAAAEQQQLVDSLRASVKPERRGAGLGRIAVLLVVLGIVGLLIALAATGAVPAAPGALPPWSLLG